jgi:hypothetical protein
LLNINVVRIESSAISANSAVKSSFASQRGVLREISSGNARKRLAWRIPPGTLRTQASENQFAFANNPLAKRTRRRLREVEPIDVLHVAAPVADEVVMLDTLRIETRGAALDSNLPHQTRFYQVAQVVVRRGPGRARIHPIHRVKNF